MRSLYVKAELLSSALKLAAGDWLENWGAGF